jgi:hypothetical protein
MAKNTQLLVDLGQGLSMMIGLPRIAVWDTSSRPKKPKQGMIGYNSKTNSLEYFNGSNWYEAGMSKG